MSSTFDRVVLGLAAIAFAPALIAGSGFAIAVGLAVGILVTGYGGRYGAEILKNQHIGSRGTRTNDFRDIVNGSGSDDTDWGKE